VHNISGAAKYGYMNGSGSDNITVIPASNVISIENVSLSSASEKRVPVRLYNSSGAAGIQLRLNYNASVVTAYSDPALDKGDFTDFYEVDNSQNTSGFILINAMKFASASNVPLALSGNPVIGYVRLKAVGNINDTSLLNLSNITLTDDGGFELPYDVHNGTFTIVFSDITPPVVTYPGVNQSDIPDDTDNEPLWGETAQLNVTVTDENGVASMT